MNWSNEKHAFCSSKCSHAAQGLRKYYALMDILRVKPNLTSQQIAPLGEQYGCPMNYQKASMRLRTLVARKLVVYETIKNIGYEQRIYKINPEIEHLPLQESMKVLDSMRKTTRRDKVRRRRAEDNAYCR